MIVENFLNVLPLLTGGVSEVVEFLDDFRFLGIKVIDLDDFCELILRFILNGGVLLLIVFYPYMKHSSRMNYTFSYLGIGSIVFLLCFMLNNVKLELGFALGLFAIFGIIRYRTDAIPFKQMTYLFVVIGVSVLNALANKKISYLELLFTNAAVVVGMWLLEKYLSRKHEGSMRIVYENIANVNINKYDIIMSELKERTGYDIKHFEVEDIDYLKDVATLVVYFNTGDDNFNG